MISRLLVLGLCLVPPAWPHRPASAERVLEIEKPRVSYVVVGSFEEGGEVFTLLLDYTTPFALPVEIFVPVRPELEQHRPAFAFLGPGLPPPTEEERAWLPFEVEEGLGVFIEANDAPEREVYFEGVMRRSMWTSGTIAVHLPQAGLYELWVWSPKRTRGDFQLGFGVEEDFSDGGWGPLFADWSDYAW